MLTRTVLARSGAPGALVVAVTLAVTGCSGDSSAGTPTTAAQTTGVVASATPTPAATGTTRPSASAPATSPGKAKPGAPQVAPVGKPSVAISLAPAVKVGEPAEIASAVRVTVGKVKDVTVKARQPGEIAGAAAAVPLTVRNGSGAAFSLDGMVVTAFYGDDIPGNETTASPSKPMTGSLAPGKTAKGTYVFNIPKKYASTLRVEVASNQSPTIVQFER